jgi:hypothetical protein
LSQPPSISARRTANDRSRSVSLALAVLLASSTTSGLAVVLARLHSVTLGASYVPATLGLPLLGASLGVAFGLLFGARAPHDRTSLFEGLRRTVGAYGFGVVLAVIALIGALRAKVPDPVDASVGAELWRTLLLAAPVFVVRGVALGDLATRKLLGARALLAADLLGVAAGPVLATPLFALGAPRAGLVLSIGLGMASLLAALPVLSDAHARPLERRTLGFRAGAFLASAIMLLWGDYGEPWLELPKARGVNLQRAVFVEWTERGLVSVDRPTSAGFAWVSTDASSRTAVHTPKSAPRTPEELIYGVLPEGDVAVLDAASVRDVRAALNAGRPRVVAVEPFDTLLRAVTTDKLAPYAGDLFSQPEVVLVREDARRYLREARGLAAIVVPGVDRGVAPHVRGAARDETRLYTTDGIRDALAALRPEGLVVIRRWDPDFGRLLQIVAPALGQGAKSHLFACSTSGATALVIGKQPLAPERIDGLRGYCKSHRFTEVFAPDAEHDPSHEALVAEGRALSSPPTDDRPTFFESAGPSELWTRLSHPFARAHEAPEATSRALLVLAALVSVAVGLFVAVALRARSAGGALPVGGALGLFVGLGESACAAVSARLFGQTSSVVALTLPLLLVGVVLAVLRRRGPTPARLLLCVAPAWLVGFAVASVAAPVWGTRVVVGLALLALAGLAMTVRFAARDGESAPSSRPDRAAPA